MQTQEGCRTTILTALKIEKMSQKIPCEKPLITEEHRQARLKFCRKWRDLTPDDWLAMFAFTDESAMQVGKSRRSYIWRTRGEDAFSPDVLKPKFSKLSQCKSMELFLEKVFYISLTFLKNILILIQIKL